ncbi:DUF3558 family protein [Mycobacteroides franklinii]|uniref:DUF3558 family protein n=1 Tax=Mycobacteroides franklinii TaxID=948102 RepID=UPI0013E8E9EF
MSRIAVWVTFILVLTGCSPSVPGAPVPSSGPPATSQLPTNAKGRVHITFDPCKDIPSSVVQQLQLDAKPPRSDTQSDGDTENVFCKYYPRGEYLLTLAASNYSLDMLRQANNEWGYQELEIGGRKALFGYRSKQPETDSCALNISATTGVYGVLISSSPGEFAPYPDCLTAARKNAEGLVPYLPL